jgi:hypothetical protein
MNKEEFLTQSIYGMGFSARVTNGCIRKKIKTLQDLLNYRAVDLLEIRNFGHMSVKEIRKKLAKFNLTLKDDLLVHDDFVRAQMMNFPSLVHQMHNSIKQMIADLKTLEAILAFFHIKNEDEENDKKS